MFAFAFNNVLPSKGIIENPNKFETKNSVIFAHIFTHV